MTLLRSSIRAPLFVYTVVYDLKWVIIVDIDQTISKGTHRENTKKSTYSNFYHYNFSNDNFTNRHC